jgi:hypothetical protein
MSFVAITFCVASQRLCIVVSVHYVKTQSGNFWIHPRKPVVFAAPHRVSYNMADGGLQTACHNIAP